MRGTTARAGDYSKREAPKIRKRYFSLSLKTRHRRDSGTLNLNVAITLRMQLS
jgi:hypothetical protein